MRTEKLLFVGILRYPALTLTLSMVFWVNSVANRLGMKRLGHVGSSKSSPIKVWVLEAAARSRALMARAESVDRGERGQKANGAG